jgi:uncharacterized protein with HEPN domain
MNRDDAYLLDMLLAARQIEEFSADLSREEFNRSRLHQLAMVRLIEIIGEAARHVSGQFQQMHPEIEWPNIIRMRSQVAYPHVDVNLDTVWSFITAKAPELIRQLESLVPPDTEED